MKYTECVPGQIYYKTHLSFAYIIRFKREYKGTIETGAYIEIDEKSSNYRNNGCNWGVIYTWEQGLREATYEEILHLEACEREGKFVERPKTPEYEIY